MERSSTMSATGRRSVRSAILERLVRDVLREQVGRCGRAELDVLDAGGGTGVVAVPLAEAGHRVTVVDPSPDSLAILRRRAAEVGVADRIRAVQGDLSELLDLGPADGADLVFCHNVLEFVDDPGAALTSIARATRPGGGLSVLVANQAAVIQALALSGRLREARAELETGSRATGSPATGAGAGQVTGVSRGDGRPFSAEVLHDLLDRAGFEAEALHGVRVFADLVPDEAGPHASDDLLALELAASGHPTFRGLGAHLHVKAHLR